MNTAKKNNKSRNRIITTKTVENTVMSRKDIRNILLIMLIYGIISLINLGSRNSPQTFWYATAKQQEVTLRIESDLRTCKLNLYTGATDAGYQILASNDEENYEEIEYILNAEVWHWYELELKENYRSIKIVALTGKEMLGEVAVFDENGRLLLLKADSLGTNLTDEQELVPYDVTYKDTSCYDEIYFARSAYEYVHGQDIYEYTHPPLGKLIMSIPIFILGMNPFAYRLMGNLAGILMLLVIYAFAKEMTRNTNAAVLASLFLALDGMHFVHTRIGTVDSFLVLFELTAFFFMYRYICCNENGDYKEKLMNLAASGFFMSLAIAVKWNGAYCALAMAVLFFQDFSRRNRKKRNDEQWIIQRKKIIAWCFFFFGAVPMGIYLLTYLPFFIHCKGNWIGEFVTLQKRMFYYHSTLQNGNYNASPFYLWPIGRTAIAYFSKQMADGSLSEIIMFGNPILWWTGLAAMIYVTCRAALKKRQNDLFLATAVVLLYVPYSFIKRDMYLYHYFSVIPLMYLCLSYALKDFIEYGSRKGVLVRTYVVTGFSIVAVLCFIFLYPIYSGLPLPINRMKPLLWVIERMLP